MEEKNSLGKSLTQLVVVNVVLGGLLFLLAGTLSWWNGWAFLAVNVLAVASVLFGVFRKYPELARERKTAAKLAKNWDRYIVPFVAGILPLASLVLAGLDKRFGWTRTLTDTHSLVALFFMILAPALIYWAMSTNRFFSSHVRIQKERGHVTVTQGPYAYVRHPGYTGMILFALSSPIQLGSLVAFWVGMVATVLVVVRTHLEDKTLQAELKGYKAYTRKVRYRLLPFVW